ncbi:glycosyl hydrolase 53 family protein [Uliginosibacterium gangwonense]|uniref:glycosyl hydrolase 53 family protein n=1 Tax=Uliginosibacterium gangwonense TaxID=392736 RepID=UPI0003647B89|nr:glycosyl hydrolase 53 family protein [Uliginosibacterium gangwonense]
MRNIPKAIRLAFIAGGLTLLCPFAMATDSAVTVQPVSDLRADFIMGADVSMLDQLEHNGGRFYDQQGIEKDCMAILKENGVNWIRLRLWNNPVNDSDIIVGGRTISHKGDPVGGGNNDLATTIRLAKRVKAQGLKFLLDIHYSDFWVDPEKQNKPAAWKDLHGEALQKAVYDYTKSVLAELKKNDVFPDMIQVGNELNGGMLWPDGKTWKEKPDEVIGGNDGFVALITQGIRAVRESDPKTGTPEHIKIAIHLANGGSNELYRRVFDLMTQRNVDYDVIGLSYYPYWHGPLVDLQANMEDISSRYGKEVVVMETSYGYTTADSDGFNNLFSADLAKSAGYKATVQGQASLVRDVINTVAQTPGERGIGIFYWEPDWIPVRNVGWRTGEGNAWENQAMFDFKGKALPSLAVFKHVRDASTPENTPQAQPVAPMKLTAFVGETFTPPDAINLQFSDDAQRHSFVEWESISADKLNQAGKFVLKGEAITYQMPVQAEVEVIPRRNMVEDNSFENGNLNGWTTTGATSAVSIEKNPGNAHTGLFSMHYWGGEPFKFEFTRKLTKIKDGKYALKAWIAGGGGEKSIELFAANCGSADPAPAKATNTGWQKWGQYTVSGIQVSGGNCTIGVRIDGTAGNWGNVDDFEFIKEGD